MFPLLGKQILTLANKPYRREWGCYLTSRIELRKSDEELLKAIFEYSPLSVAELSRVVGKSRSWVWKKVNRLRRLGLVQVEKRGGVLRTIPTNASYRGLLRLGILRASEYPYILHFKRALKSIAGSVDVLVYDEAFKLALDLARGKVHLAMAPLPSLLAVHRISGGGVVVVGGGSRGGAGVALSRRAERIESVATTMASSMELCLEYTRVKGRRIYMRGGYEILEAVLQGRVDAGALWQPYLDIAEGRGLGVLDCNIPFCCLLGANASLAELAGKIRTLLEQAIQKTRSGMIDVVAYSSLLELDTELVRRTLGKYEFLEEPPLSDIKNSISILRRVVLPDSTWREAILA